MERTEEQRCKVLWLMGLRSSSLSREAKLRAFRNLGRERGEARERIRGERLGQEKEREECVKEKRNLVEGRWDHTWAQLLMPWIRVKLHLLRG